MCFVLLITGFRIERQRNERGSSSVSTQDNLVTTQVSSYAHLTLLIPSNLGFIIRIVCFVGINICYEFLFALRRLSFTSTDFPTILPASSLTPPSLRTSPRKLAVKQYAVTKRRRKAIKVSCGLQPVVLSLAPSKKGERREKIYFFTSPSTSARVTSHQVSARVFLLYN